MKLLLILLFLTSCAHSVTKKDLRLNTDKTFRPFIDNMVLNYNLQKYDKQIKTGYEVPVKFDEIGYSNLYWGYCRMRKHIIGRQVFINPKYWYNHPDKQEKILRYMLSFCILSNGRYGDVLYRQ